MARQSFLSRLRRPGDESRPGAEVEANPVPAGVRSGQRRPLPPPGRLRRERRALIRTREDRIRDLGGLVLEMYRRDDFRSDLVYEQCAELAALEERLQELDALLSAAVNVRRPARAARCECGTPIIYGSRFCASCGRALAAPTEQACGSCGSAIPADARFCAACGATVGPSAPELAAEAEDSKAAR